MEKRLTVRNLYEQGVLPSEAKNCYKIVERANNKFWSGQEISAEDMRNYCEAKATLAHFAFMALHKSQWKDASRFQRKKEEAFAESYRHAKSLSAQEFF